jgi:putative endonuclease
MSTSSLKERGEGAAVAFLERCGMTIVERRWSCDSGQIDVIALDEGQLVLVDVQTVQASRQKELGSVSAAVARRINKVATAYTEANDLGDIAWRFDRISILVIAEDRALLRHHRDALAVGE